MTVSACDVLSLMTANGWRLRAADVDQFSSLRCRRCTVSSRFAVQRIMDSTAARSPVALSRWCIVLKQQRLSLSSQQSIIAQHRRLSHPKHGTETCAVSSAVVWNCLPAELRVSSLTAATFARHLKTHLFSCLN